MNLANGAVLPSIGSATSLINAIQLPEKVTGIPDEQKPSCRVQIYNVNMLGLD
jgi:hypothetical protein